MSWRKGELPDPERFGKIKFLCPVPSKKDYWGILGSMRDTLWWPEIISVHKDVYNDAINGWVTPLRKSLGTPPLVRAKRLPVLATMCAEYQDKSCLNRSEYCRPGTGKMPSCYVPPIDSEAARHVATDVAEAWDDGRFVFAIRED